MADTSGEARLEAAARRALAIGANSYCSVESILTHRLDERPGEQIELGAPVEHTNIRSAYRVAGMGRPGDEAGGAERGGDGQIGRNRRAVRIATMAPP